MRTCAYIYAIISPSAIRKVNVCASMLKIVQAERRAKLAWALLRRGRCSRRSLKERLIFESRRQKYSKFLNPQWLIFRLSRNLSSFRLLVHKSVQLLAFSPTKCTRKTQKQIFSGKIPNCKLRPYKIALKRQTNQQIIDSSVVIMLNMYNNNDIVTILFVF